MRNRIDVIDNSKLLIDDMIERGFFRDTQSLIAAALAALQTRLAESTYTDEYDEESYQKNMDEIQLRQDTKEGDYHAEKRYNVR